MASRCTLHVEHADGGRDEIVWALDRNVIKIGRLPSAQVVLRDDTASRMHAVLERAGNACVVIDLGAASGTFLNGKKVNKSTLGHGDVLRLGNSNVTLQVEDRPLPERPDLSPPQTAPPTRTGSCPRCGERLELHQAASAAYRSAPMRFLSCDACALSVLESATLEARYGRSRPLRGRFAERERRSADEVCPVCLDTLERVTLEWGGEWVVVEECPICGTVVLDAGEGASLDALMAKLDDA